MENINEKIKIIIEVLESIKERLNSPDTNFLHSRFDSQEDIINELENHILKLKNKDFSNIEELIILFAPTSDLQEIAIDSGWGQQFLDFAERFDSAIDEIIEEFNIKLF